MTVRNILLTASLAALVACGGRDDNSTPDSGLPTGCTGVCSTPDSGTPDSGTPDSGTPHTDSGTCGDYLFDGGTIADPGTLDAGVQVSIFDLRYGHSADGGYVQYGTHALMTGMVVTQVASVKVGTQSDVAADFWITDPNDPRSGMAVYQQYFDNSTYSPQVGDVVNLDGFFETEKAYQNTVGSRYVLEEYYKKPDSRSLIVTPTGSATPPAENQVDAGCFGDNQNGHAFFNQHREEFAGTRIHVNGPLTITSATPVALTRLVQELDGGWTTTGFNGFEVSGGILVNDSKTYSSDGGFGDPDRCDWRALAAAGHTVTFPNGIHGTWDTYSLAPCQTQADGGCYALTGYVPNDTNLTPAPDSGSYTFVVYPSSCADLAGDAGAGVTP